MVLFQTQHGGNRKNPAAAMHYIIYKVWRLGYYPPPTNLISN